MSVPRLSKSSENSNSFKESDRKHSLTSNKITSSNHECAVCNNYVRKIKEIQQTVSGRDIIIEMLQKQIKKCEGHYKELLDDYEKLRLQYCTTDYELNSLREINQKLDEISSRRECRCSKNAGTDWRQKEKCTQQPQSSKDNLQDELESCKKECQRLKSKLQQIEHSGDTNKNGAILLPEVEKIERLIDDQNNALKALLAKVNQSDNIENDIENITKLNEQIKQSSLNTVNSNVLEEKIKSLTSELEVCCKLNDTLKTMLMEKKSKLSTCIDNLSDNNFDLTKISNSIENMMGCKEIEKLRGEIKDRDQIIKELKHKKTSSPSESAAQQTEERPNDNKDLKKQISDLIDCKCKLIVQLDQAEENNNMLSDTLVIVTEENKSNLEKIKNLNDNVQKTTQELEECKCEHNYKVSTLETELEKRKSNEEELRKALKYSADKESGKICSDIETNTSSENDPVHLQREINELKKELHDKLIEFSECDEEKRGFSQKITRLNREIQELKDEIAKTRDELDRKCNAEEEQKKLVRETRRVSEESTNSCQIVITDLKSTVDNQKKQITLLQVENASLKQQIEALKEQNNATINNMRNEIHQSQDNIDALLKDHNQKNEQLRVVCQELESLKETVCEENEKCHSHVKQLEEHNITLKQQTELLECDCSKLKGELEKIKVENLKKQTIIDELEDTVDSSKEILEQCEKKVKDLVSENKSLKYREKELQTEIKKLSADIEQLKAAVAGSVKETETKMRAMEEENSGLKQHMKMAQMDVKFLTEKCKTQCQQMQMQNDRRNADTEQAQAIKDELTICKEKCEKLKQQLNALKLDNNKLAGEAQTVKVQERRRSSQAESEKEQISNELRNSIAMNEDIRLENGRLKAKYEKLVKDYEQKQDELVKCRKELEGCCKTSKLTREEYQNLKKEYKEIKKMLSEQIQKYKHENLLYADDTKPTLPSNSICIEFKRKLQEKENEIANLQSKLQASSLEIIDLKDYIHKLVSDNRSLRNSINTMITDLERKIRGANNGDLRTSSAELVAGDILKSLTSIENKILKKSSSCPIKECDCISEIVSKASALNVLKNNTNTTKQDTAKITGEFKCDCAERDTTIISNSKQQTSGTSSEECDCEFGNSLNGAAIDKIRQSIEFMKSQNVHVCTSSNCPKRNLTQNNVEK